MAEQPLPMPPIDHRLVEWLEQTFRPMLPELQEIKDQNFPIDAAFLAGQASVAKILRSHLTNQVQFASRQKEA